MESFSMRVAADGAVDMLSPQGSDRQSSAKGAAKLLIISDVCPGPVLRYPSLAVQSLCIGDLCMKTLVRTAAAMLLAFGLSASTTGQQPFTPRSGFLPRAQDQDRDDRGGREQH